MRSKLGDTVKCNTFFMTELIKSFSYVKISVSETSFRFRSWIVNFLDSFPLWLQWQASVSSFILFFLARYFYLWHKFGVQKLRLMIKDRYAITWWHYTFIHLQSFQQTTGERPWRKWSSLDLAFRRKSNLPSVSSQFFFRSLLCDDLSQVTTDSCGPKLALLFFLFRWNYDSFVFRFCH